MPLLALLHVLEAKLDGVQSKKNAYDFARIDDPSADKEMYDHFTQEERAMLEFCRGRGIVESLQPNGITLDPGRVHPDVAKITGPLETKIEFINEAFAKKYKLIITANEHTEYRMAYQREPEDIKAVILDLYVTNKHAFTIFSVRRGAWRRIWKALSGP